MYFNSTDFLIYFFIVILSFAVLTMAEAEIAIIQYI